MRHTRIPAEFRSFHVGLIRYEFEKPCGWTKSNAETLAIARKRRQIAERELRKIRIPAMVSRQLATHRLTNPYSTDQAWRLLLNLAKKVQRI